jgi:hypothetical protein
MTTDTGKVTIKVYHNLTSRFMPYTIGDKLYEAIVFESGLPACGSMERLLEIIWHQLNIDEPHALWAIEYRRRRNRSLSVGDVVAIGEQAWAVDRFGWTSISIGAQQIWHYVGDVADGPVLAQPRQEA